VSVGVVIAIVVVLLVLLAGGLELWRERIRREAGREKWRGGGD
jgi:hypothetical protein